MANIGRNKPEPRTARNEQKGASLNLPQSQSKAEDRTNRIAEAAYYRAQARNFEPGHELEDWVAAEAEIDAQHN